MKPGAIIDSMSTTPQTRGLSNLSAAPHSRGPVQGPPLLPPQPLMQALPSHMPPILPNHAPQLGAPYSLGQSLDCAPQVPIMTSVPTPAQTSLPPASIQSPAPMLQNPITMTKVSVTNMVNIEYIFNCVQLLESHFNSYFLVCLSPAFFMLTAI